MTTLAPAPPAPADPSSTSTSSPADGGSNDDAVPTLAQKPLTPAEQALVDAHVRLAFHLVNRRYGRDHPFADDLAQEACIGVMEAARRFDPSRGIAFGTYVGWWIRSKLSGFMRRRRLRLKIDGATSFDDPDGPPEPADPASALRPLDILIADEAAESDADLLQSALAGLSPRERTVLLRRAGGETLREIGTDLGVSKERVRQIETAALARAREAARDRAA